MTKLQRKGLNDILNEDVLNDEENEISEQETEREGEGATPSSLPGPEPVKRPQKPKGTQSTIYISQNVRNQIRQLGMIENCYKINDYYLEAIDMLFAQRGLKSIAELDGEE